MILGIDATNIRSGGGLTHLKEILRHADPISFRFDKVIVWSNHRTLAQLPDAPWLQKRSHNWLNKSFIFSFLFQFLLLSRKARTENCSILFVPGGTFLGNFKEIVTMSQNMLPFEKVESSRFTDFKSRLKFRLLRYTQHRTFNKAKGIIFLTKYARDYITNAVSLVNDSVIIPHGINLSFLNKPKEQIGIEAFSNERPFKLLYVSIVTAYKHQWNVSEAVIKLRLEGYPITLDLVGSSTPEYLKKLQESLRRNTEDYITYHGEIPYDHLPDFYKNADSFVFASSCENMPIILIEAMTAGLPIASSNFGPMPEVLGDSGFYFNPLDPQDIYRVLKEMLTSDDLRQLRSRKSYEKSIHYTWKDCSKKTFKYLSEKAHS